MHMCLLKCDITDWVSLKSLRCYSQLNVAKIKQELSNEHQEM